MIELPVEQNTTPDMVASKVHIVQVQGPFSNEEQLILFRKVEALKTFKEFTNVTLSDTDMAS